MQGDTIYVDVEICDGSGYGINKSYIQLIKVRTQSMNNVKCYNN